MHLPEFMAPVVISNVLSIESIQAPVSGVLTVSLRVSPEDVLISLGIPAVVEWLQSEGYTIESSQE